MTDAATLSANKELVRRYVAALNAEDYDALDDILDPDVVRNIGGPDGTGTRGIAQAKQGARSARAVWHNDRQVILDLIAEGDRVVAHLELHGVHAGEWLGIPATHKEVVFHGAFIYRIAGGRIVEILRYVDDMSRLRQLGGLRRT